MLLAGIWAVGRADSRCFGGGLWMGEMVVGVWSEGARRKGDGGG